MFDTKFLRRMLKSQKELVDELRIGDQVFVQHLEESEMSCVYQVVASTKGLTLISIEEEQEPILVSQLKKKLMDTYQIEWVRKCDNSLKK